MEGKSTIETARNLFESNFIGANELEKIKDLMGFTIPQNIPEIHYSIHELEKYAKDYILILGIEEMTNGTDLNIIALRDRFGTNPTSEPCFYNQDWYLQESFTQKKLENRWYLIKKTVFEDSRAVIPNILEKKHNFPSAILCSFTFFSYFFLSGNILWKQDFVWCSDFDHNGDRIYVGKYCDVHGINKNGFSIHRHLSLRDFYGSISIH